MRYYRKVGQYIGSMLCLLLLFPIDVWAGPTCGCSEVCPVALMDAANDPSKGLLSDSIWGNMILKMAYSHDQELQRLLRKRRHFGSAAYGALGVISGGTLGQNISSIALLNPAPGFEDSYAPGIVGLALDGVTNVVISGGMLVRHAQQKRITARRREIRSQVEAILEHLEYSASNCTEAQHDLAELIGERGAQECIQLWQSAHVAAAVEEKSPRESRIEQSVRTLVSVADQL
jgi:hypothetical protein